MDDECRLVPLVPMGQGPGGGGWPGENPRAGGRVGATIALNCAGFFVGLLIMTGDYIVAGKSERSTTSEPASRSLRRSPPASSVCCWVRNDSRISRHHSRIGSAIIRRGGKEKAIPESIIVEEAQAHLKEIIDKLAPGDEVIRIEHQQPVARLVAARPAERKLGTMLGTVRQMAPDFDAPLEDFKEYME